MDIRQAVAGEQHRIVELINDLIVELGGAPLPLDEGGAATTALAFIDGALDGHILVAEQDDRLVGICTLTFQPSIRTLGKYGIVQEMYVDPEFRNEKVGERLIEAAASLAKRAGCPMVELSTPPDGEQAENFYRGVGFDQVGVRMRYKF
jgi:GNAT superfamily N-acetyltransferase